MAWHLHMIAYTAFLKQKSRTKTMQNHVVIPCVLSCSNKNKTTEQLQNPAWFIVASSGHYEYKTGCGPGCG